jgi:hypothetical protein
MMRQQFMLQQQQQQQAMYQGQPRPMQMQTGLPGGMSMQQLQSLQQHNPQLFQQIMSNPGMAQQFMAGNMQMNGQNAVLQVCNETVTSMHVLIIDIFAAAESAAAVHGKIFFHFSYTFLTY